MPELEVEAGRMTEGSVDLNEEMYRHSLDRGQLIEPGSAYERAVKDRLRAKGMDERQIEERLSLGRPKPSSGLDMS